MNGIKSCIPFGIWFLPFSTKHLKIQLDCVTQRSAPFYYRVVFPWMDVLVYTPTHQLMEFCFWVGAIVKKMAISINIFVCSHSLCFTWVVSQSRFLGLRASVGFSLLENAKCFLKGKNHFCISTTCVRPTVALHPLQHLVPKLFLLCQVSVGRSGK